MVAVLDEKILGFSNRWYRAAMKFSVTQRLSDDLEIRMVSGPVFIAAKSAPGRGEPIANRHCGAASGRSRVAVAGDSPPPTSLATGT